MFSGAGFHRPGPHGNSGGGRSPSGTDRFESYSDPPSVPGRSHGGPEKRKTPAARIVPASLLLESESHAVTVMAVSTRVKPGKKVVRFIIPWCLNRFVRTRNMLTGSGMTRTGASGAVSAPHPAEKTVSVYLFWRYSGTGGCPGIPAVSKRGSGVAGCGFLAVCRRHDGQWTG